MHVLLSPDKFKGCLTGAEVADALAEGLTAVVADLQVTRLPVADGGDGTVAAALEAGYTEVLVDAVGPTGQPVRAPLAIKDQVAVVELAAVVGLDQLPDRRLDPLGASTYGLGQLISAALDHGATEVVLGLGGSASTDGGAGLLQALGARLLDVHSEELPLGGGALTDLASVDLAALRDRVGSTQFVVAIDVDNPLLGPTGAAATFGPQKGADADDLLVLEQGLRTWSEVITRAIGRDVTQVPGTGAAGGAGYAAVAVLDATVRPGIELVLELVGFDAAVVGADLVITGEGSLDEQSLSGKAPIGVATAAGQAGVRVVAVAGRNQLSPERLAAAGISQAYALSELEPDVGRSMANAAPLLGQVGSRIAREWLA